MVFFDRRGETMIDDNYTKKSTLTMLEILAAYQQACFIIDLRTQIDLLKMDIPMMCNNWMRQIVRRLSFDEYLKMKYYVRRAAIAELENHDATKTEWLLGTVVSADELNALKARCHEQFAKLLRRVDKTLTDELKSSFDAHIIQQLDRSLKVIFKLPICCNCEADGSLSFRLL